MSNLIAELTVIAASATLVALAMTLAFKCWDCRNMKRRIEELTGARKETQDLADRIKKELTSMMKCFHVLRAEYDTQAINLQTRELQIQYIVSSIWGFPPLENRNADDVVAHIRALHGFGMDWREKAVKLTGVYKELSELIHAKDAALSARVEDYNMSQGALREIQDEYMKQRHQKDVDDENFTFLMENKLAVLQSGALNCWIVMQACTTGTPVGSGPNPTAAIEDAKTALHRKDLGLSS